MWSLYLAIGAGSIPVLFLINDDDEGTQAAHAHLHEIECVERLGLHYIKGQL